MGNKLKYQKYQWNGTEHPIIIEVEDDSLIEEAVKFLESKFSVGERAIGQFSITDEKYITICTGGIKEEATGVPFYAATPELAVIGWWNAVLNYAYEVDEKAILYWRLPPELIEHKHAIINDPEADESEVSISYPLLRLYYVRARLLISSKKPLTREEFSAKYPGTVYAER